MMNPLLSIITPVYNVESYLDRCVQSILTQSYNDIELILIDDGSTDGSSLLCDKWAEKDRRVIVIHQCNGGVSAARNAGLKVVKGDYLTFVDPDDFIASDTYVSNMTYLMEHQEVDFLQYPYCHYFSDDVIQDYHCPTSDLLVGSEQIFRNWWSGSPLEFTTCTKIYRRTLWNDVLFKVGHVSEDTSLVAVFTSRAQVVYISDQGMYYYQQNRKDSYTYHYDFSKHMDLFNAHSDIYKCFESFPDMVSEKVIAFTRLFRRLITAKQTDESADIRPQINMVSNLFPSWNEIMSSRNTEKVWLSVAKILGPKLFVVLFVRYLKLMSRF